MRHYSERGPQKANESTGAKISFVRHLMIKGKSLAYNASRRRPGKVGEESGNYRVGSDVVVKERYRSKAAAFPKQWDREEEETSTRKAKRSQNSPAAEDAGEDANRPFREEGNNKA